MDDALITLQEQWDRAADAWRRWQQLFVQRQDTAWLLEAAGVTTGQRVLDVGAGTGDQTMASAAAVGPTGSVVAIDVSPGMLKVAEMRASEAGHSNVEFVPAAAERLHLPSGTVDAAVSAFALMFSPDPVAAARNVAALLAPGGRWAVTVWGPPPEVPMLATPMLVATGEFGITPPPPGGPGLFGLADRQRFEAVLSEAGLVDVRVEDRQFDFAYGSADEYTSFLREVAPVIDELVAEQAPGRQDEFWDRVRDTVAARAADDGPVTFSNTVLLGVGTAPH